MSLTFSTAYRADQASFLAAHQQFNKKKFESQEFFCFKFSMFLDFCFVS